MPKGDGSSNRDKRDNFSMKWVANHRNMLNQLMAKAEKDLSDAIENKTQDPRLSDVEMNLLRQYEKFVYLDEFGIALMDAKKGEPAWRFQLTPEQIKTNNECIAKEAAKCREAKEKHAPQLAAASASHDTEAKDESSKRRQGDDDQPPASSTAIATRSPDAGRAGSLGSEWPPLPDATKQVPATMASAQDTTAPDTTAASASGTAPLPWVCQRDFARWVARCLPIPDPLPVHLSNPVPRGKSDPAPAPAPEQHRVVVRWASKSRGPTNYTGFLNLVPPPQPTAASAPLPPMPTRPAPYRIFGAHQVQPEDDHDWTLPENRNDWQEELKGSHVRNLLIKKQLLEAKSVQYKSIGRSMFPQIDTINDHCLFEPVCGTEELDKVEINDGDVVFCQLQPSGHFCAHKVRQVEDPAGPAPKYWIANNICPGVRGWCHRCHIYGRLIEVCYVTRSRPTAALAST